MIGGGSRPIVFTGTREEANANRATHDWQIFRYGHDEDDAEAYCAGCDAKPWHKAAEYPCGTRVPRERWDPDKKEYVPCDE